MLRVLAAIAILCACAIPAHGVGNNWFPDLSWFDPRPAASAARLAEKTSIECMTIGAIREAMETKPGYKNLRRVRSSDFKTAIRYFNSRPDATKGDSKGDWDSAIMVDAPGGGGIIAVGHGEELCMYVQFHVDDWPSIVRDVEGWQARQKRGDSNALSLAVFAGHFQRASASSPMWLSDLARAEDGQPSHRSAA